MLSLSRIRILIKAGAVKLSQSEGVSREMCRYPVEDDTNLMFMQIIHKELKILCGTVTGSRCKIAGYLISPGTVKRMLRDTHQFHMGVTHILHVSGQFHRQLSVVIIAVLVLIGDGVLLPGTRMHLIDKHRILPHIKLTAVLHPFLITPLEVGNIRDHGGIVRPFFPSGKRTGLFLILHYPVLSSRSICKSRPPPGPG